MIESRNAIPAGPVFAPNEDFNNLCVVRTRPRLDLHKLAQYLEATPNGRRQILLGEKYPSPFRMSYNQAKNLFSEAIRLEWGEETLYGVAAERWCLSRPETDLSSLRRRQSMDAIIELGSMMTAVKEQLCRRKASVRGATRALAPLDIGGVQLILAPELVLVRKNRRERGLLSVHASRTRPHTEESAKMAAALVREVAEANPSRFGEASGKLCLVIDVFGGVVVDANRGNKRRLFHATKACEEIAALWSKL